MFFCSTGGPGRLYRRTIVDGVGRPDAKRQADVRSALRTTGRESDDGSGTSIADIPEHRVRDKATVKQLLQEHREIGIVRLVIGFSLILWGIGWLACQVEGTPVSKTPMNRAATNRAATNRATVTTDDHWVRTADGWEKTGQWMLSPQHAPTLHPLVVASLEGLFSLMALIAFPTAWTGDAASPAGKRSRMMIEHGRGDIAHGQTSLSAAR